MVVRNREGARIFGAAGLSQYVLEDLAKAAIHRRPDGGVYTLEELPLYRALHRGESTRAEEVRLEFPDGHSIPTLVNATPVYSASGEITGAIAIIQSITPFEEVERLRSEFLGIVSHELRTPLTAIKGSAATVLGSRRPLDAAETREFFQIIDEQADRLSGLIDNLLDMTRIEAGSLSVTTEPADLGALLSEARDPASEHPTTSFVESNTFTLFSRRAGEVFTATSLQLTMMLSGSSEIETMARQRVSREVWEGIWCAGRYLGRRRCIDPVVRLARKPWMKHGGKIAQGPGH